MFTRSEVIVLTDKQKPLKTRAINNSQHVLQPMLPAKHDSQYNLRTKTHGRLLICTSADLKDCDLVICMLYKPSY